MDTGTGNIYDFNEIQNVDIKGKIVTWKVGEIVEVKGCRFKVEKIEKYPSNRVILKGEAKLEDLVQQLGAIEEKPLPPTSFLDGVRNLKK